MIVERGTSSVLVLELVLPQETVRFSDFPYPDAEGRIIDGGIGEVSSMVAVESSTVPAGELSVTVSDKGERLEKLLEGAYDCRRAAATLTRHLADGTTVRRFTGVLDSWDFDAEWPETATLRLRVDDSTIQNGWVPHLSILKSEWGEGSYAMPDGVAGTGVPYLYGSHNSAGVTGKGFAPLICVGQTGSTGRYLVCFGQAKSKIGTWKADGTVISGTLEVVQRGGKTFTTVNFTSGITAGLGINGDFEGYEAVGDGTGVLITNPISQLRHLLNVVYGDQRTGNWTTSDVAPIHAVSWAAAAEWCDRYKLEGSAYIGGTTEKTSLKAVIERWLASFPLFKLAWNPYGQLVLVNLGLAIEWPGYPTASSRRLNAESDQTGLRTQVRRDTSNIARQVSAEHIFSATESKSYASLDVQDPAVVERVTTSIQMDWSLARAA